MRSLPLPLVKIVIAGHSASEDARERACISLRNVER